MYQKPMHLPYYECWRCGVRTQHDHEGNGCHSCGLGSMRKVAR